MSQPTPPTPNPPYVPRPKTPDDPKRKTAQSDDMAGNSVANRYASDSVGTGERDMGIVQYEKPTSGWRCCNCLKGDYIVYNTKEATNCKSCNHAQCLYCGVTVTV